MLEINNTTNFKINTKKTRKLVESFLDLYKKRLKFIYNKSTYNRSINKKTIQISLALVGSKRIRTLNRGYRQQDKTTDVLSFSNSKDIFNPNVDYNYLGEIVINVEELKKISKYKEVFKELGLENKKKYFNSNYLFHFLLVHGLLHLLAYDDNTKKKRFEMLILGRDFLDKMLYYKGKDKNK